MSALGVKLRLAARYVEPGDFTTLTGFRGVVRAEPVEVFHGRGKKRTSYIADVRLHRVDGTYDVIPAEQEVLVYRKGAA